MSLRAPLPTGTLVAAADETVDRRLRKLLDALYKLLLCPLLPFHSPDVPEQPGVYAIYDGSRFPCYVGQSRNLRRLLVDHRRGNGKSSIFRRKLLHAKGLNDEVALTDYICRKCAFRILEIESEREGLRLEHFATAPLQPVLNGVGAGRMNGTGPRGRNICLPNV